jgi:hypothetical protein
MDRFWRHDRTLRATVATGEEHQRYSVQVAVTFDGAGEWRTLDSWAPPVGIPDLSGATWQPFRLVFRARAA